MMVMVSNHSSLEVGYLAGIYPGLLGHLYSPSGRRGPYDFMPHGLDGDVYGAWEKNIPWDREAWIDHVEWSAKRTQEGMRPPLWGAAPDVVTDHERTLAQWPEYAAILRAHGIRPAFVLQDGATFDEVPDAECMLFIGGSTAWKEAAIGPWCHRFPGRVHVGRVTERKRLMKCYEAGAVSVDGNGWHMKTNKPGQRIQFDDLKTYLALAARERKQKAA